MEEVEPPLEIDGVDSFHAHTEGHLEDAEDDCELHLVRIEETKLILGQVPYWVDSERVDAVLVCL